jgi:polysaccharide chain length determinant protein (PEP-CTERM system associated)
MEPALMTFKDFLDILSRRKWSLIVPAGVVMLVSIVVALLLPPVYKSTATILIESQDIPEDFVMTTVTSFAEQRIQSINQRIMSFTRLMEVIERFDLYPDLRRKRTNEEVVERMREDTSLRPISAEIVDPRTGRPATAVIAFSLSYQGHSPRKVQEVTNTLTSQLLKENIRTRVQQVEDTSDFLKSEIEKIKVELADLDARLAAFKQEHINELPEMMQVNQQSLNNIERQIEVAGEKLRSLKEREEYLKAEFATVKPHLANAESLSRNLLEQLKVELARLRQQFTDDYPDVKKLKAEINELEAKKQVPASSDTSTNARPDNPAYITLSAQLAGIRTEIVSVERQVADLEERAATYRSRIAATPKVEDSYNDLLTARNLAHVKHEDLMRKLMEARLAQGLEKDQKGERFSLIETPVLPEKPFKPNRLVIVLIGVVLGIGAGGGLGYLREVTDDSVRSVDRLAAAARVPVLVGIPEIMTPRDIARRRSKRYALLFGTFGAVVMLVLVFHFFVMDLNVFWVKVMRRLAV